MVSTRNSRWRKARWRRSPAVPALGLMWLAAAVALMIWQSISYRGLAFAVAEFQYTQFGQVFPVLTLVPLVFLLSLPGLVLLWVRLPPRAAGARVQSALVRTLAAEHRLLRILLAGSGLFGIVAVCLVVFSLFEPNARGPAQVVDARVATRPHEGHARLTGTVLLARTATFEQDVLFLHRPVRFAPVISAPDQPVRYFVEITPDRLDMLRTQGATVTFDGIIKRNALPGPVEQLFRYAGFNVDHQHYGLLASTTSVRMPIYVMALNALLAAICLGILALYQRLRVNRAQAMVIRAEPPTVQAS